MRKRVSTSLKIFKNEVGNETEEERTWNTSKTFLSSFTIRHSSGNNLCIVVIESIVGQNSRAKWSILKVKFHCIDTFWGIMWRGKLAEVSVLDHCGRRMVIEFFITYASLWSLDQPSELGSDVAQLCFNLALSALNGLAGFSCWGLPALPQSICLEDQSLEAACPPCHQQCYLDSHTPHTPPDHHSLKPICHVSKCLCCMSIPLTFFAFGMSNCLIINFAMMLRMWRKHLVWFAGLGESLRSTISSSLFAALLAGSIKSWVLWSFLHWLNE